VNGAHTWHHGGETGFYVFQVFCEPFLGNPPDQKMPMPADYIFPLIAEFIAISEQKDERDR